MGEMEEKARLSGYKAGYYYIEQQTINVLLVGTTRSGKGEAWVNSSIEVSHIFVFQHFDYHLFQLEQIHE